MKRAILEVDDEHKCTNAGTPSSSTIRKALPGLKARFHRAPAAVSCTSYNRNASSGPPTTVLLFRSHKKTAAFIPTCQPATHTHPTTTKYYKLSMLTVSVNQNKNRKTV